MNILDIKMILNLDSDQKSNTREYKHRWEK